MIDDDRRGLIAWMPPPTTATLRLAVKSEIDLWLGCATARMALTMDIEEAMGGPMRRHRRAIDRQPLKLARQ